MVWPIIRGKSYVGETGKSTKGVTLLISRHAGFEYTDGGAYIEARFASGKLNYLATSKSETC
jgi:hypothetical protein